MNNHEPIIMNQSIFAPAAPADEMVDLFKRHCVLSDVEVDAIVLWLIASYLINSFRIFPKLALISPEKRCGKTTTMEVIQSLSKDGLLLSNISAAAIFRITQQLQPTLLIDEADTFLKDGAHELVGLINSSHTKSGANVLRCVGDDHQAKRFSTWMPIILASIGDLPPTLMDRSIIINLRRKAPHESTVDLPVDLFELQEPVRDKLAAWSTFNESAIKTATQVVPHLGNSRAEDNWKPMYAVAQVIGGIWPDRCLAACAALTKPVELELPTLLLSAIKYYFQETREDRVSSKALVNEICKDATGPWQECNNGKSLTQSQVAKLLSGYGIRTKNMRFGEIVDCGTWL